MRNVARLVGWVILLLTMGAALWAFAQDAPPPFSIAPGQKAPPLKLEPVGGGVPFSLDQFKGKPTLIVFWASWCPHCRDEMPLLKQVYQQYTAKGLRIVTVGVNANQTPEELVAYQIEQELPFIILWDGEGAAARAWGVTGFPTNFFIDADGIVRAEGYAITDQMKQLIREAMETPAKK